MNRSDKACALCAHYSVKEAPAGTERGKGACKGYEGAARVIEPVVSFDDWCVLWRPAGADMGARRQYAEKMRRGL